MRKAVLTSTLVLTCATAFAQRPSDPALLIPQSAPDLDYIAVLNTLPAPEGPPSGARDIAYGGVDGGGECGLATALHCGDYGQRRSRIAERAADSVEAQPEKISRNNIT